MVLEMLAAVAIASEPKVEVATAADCAVLVEVGKLEVAWGPTGPNQPFVDEGPMPDGTIYRQKCDWRALGVGEPTIAKPGQTGPRFAVEKPVYSQDGNSAETAINFVVWSGPGTTPFISIHLCSLRKEGKVWRVVKCEQGLVT